MTKFLILVIVFSFSRVFAAPAELQWLFCDNSRPDVIRILSLSPVHKKKLQQVYYLETRSADFEQHDVFVKFRRAERGKIKSTVKRHFVSARAIPSRYRNDPDFDCEKDVYLDTQRWSCSIKREGTDFALTPKQMKVIDDAKVSETKVHEAFLLGPLKGFEQDFKDDVEFEQLTAPNGNIVSELSVRSDLLDQAETQNEWQDAIQKTKLSLCPIQSGKRSLVLKDLWMAGAFVPYSQL